MLTQAMASDGRPDRSSKFIERSIKHRARHAHPEAHARCVIGGVALFAALALAILDQIPLIAVQVFEHRHGSVWHFRRWSGEFNAAAFVGFIVAPEIVSLQE